MKKLLFGLVFIGLFASVFYVSWNIQMNRQGSATVFSGVYGVYGNKSDPVVMQREDAERARKKINGFVEIQTPEMAVNYSKLFKYSYPEFSTALDGFSKSPDIGQSSIRLNVKRGIVTQSSIHTPHCVFQFDTKDPSLTRESFVETAKRVGGVCGPVATAKSIIKVLGIPPEVYADSTGKNFKKEFLEDLVSKNTSDARNSTLDGSISMHENYKYNGYTFDCGNSIDVMDYSVKTEDRKADFEKKCKDFSDNVAAGQDCVIAMFNRDHSKGHAGMIESASYNAATGKCKYTVSATGHSTAWTRNKYETGPVNEGSDTWEAKVQLDSRLSKFPFDITPTKSSNLYGTAPLEQEKYVSLTYACCKKVPVK